MRIRVIDGVPQDVRPMTYLEQAAGKQLPTTLRRVEE
jgi:hypothetical protein